MCFGCNVLLLVNWFGLNVIGLVFVVGWERGVVCNVVLDGLCSWLGCLFVCKVFWDQWCWCECFFVLSRTIVRFCFNTIVLVPMCFVVCCLFTFPM